MQSSNNNLALDAMHLHELTNAEMEQTDGGFIGAAIGALALGILGSAIYDFGCGLWDGAHAH